MKKLCSLVDYIVVFNTDTQINHWISIQNIVICKNKLVRINDILTRDRFLNIIKKYNGKKILIIGNCCFVDSNISLLNFKLNSTLIQCFTNKFKNRYEVDSLDDISSSNAYLITYKFNPDKIFRKYDFDIAIAISSYNRYEKLTSIINQINAQHTKYTYKFFILNDGSTDIRYNHMDLVDNTVLIKNKTNGGKHRYWKTITKLFKETSKFNYKTLIQIDDDFILCNNFLNEMMRLFDEKKCDVIHYHINTDKTESNRWGLGSQWIDGGSAFKRNVLCQLGFEVHEINDRRWKVNNILSSGVWQQLSHTINRLNRKIYKPEKTLAVHSGNDDSKMNSNLRDVCKIHSNY